MLLQSCNDKCSCIMLIIHDNNLFNFHEFGNCCCMVSLQYCNIHICILNYHHRILSLHSNNNRQKHSDSVTKIPSDTGC